MRFAVNAWMAGFCWVAAAAPAAQYFVATNGNDSAAGTLAQPWRTIQKAANTLLAGDTACVRGGRYSEAVSVNVSGSAAGGPVTLQNYPGETPVLDGTGLKVPNGANGMFFVSGQSYVSIQGFEICNYQTNSSALVPAGIYITGPAHDLLVVSNRIHDIVNLSADGNGFGLAVYGTSSAQPITNLVICGNELFQLQTGQSESLVLNGNVTGFLVGGNRVHDNNNIGIDFIGFEGTCADPAQDFARNGSCRSNQVWNISSYGNPGYGNNYGADGLYCDGASNVVIQLNQVWNCDIGVELASEHAGHAASHISLRDNLVWSNSIGGVFMGGYDAQRGLTEYCQVVHNTLYQNDTLQQGNGEIYLQYYTASNVIADNVVVANSQGLLVGSPYPATNTMDWNLYFTPAGAANAQWQRGNVTYTGLLAWQGGASEDAHSVFADPLLVNPAAVNFHLSITSPAFNAGDPAFLPAAGETDIDGQARVAFGRTDMGADEINVLRPAVSVAGLVAGGLWLQLIGEPGHPYAWERSGTLSDWESFVTNYANAAGVAGITNSMGAGAGFFRGRVVQ